MVDLKSAIAVFDKSVDRTTPNAQTEAWKVIRAELMRLQDAPVVTLTTGDDPETNEPCAEILDVFPSEWAGSRVRLVPDGDACIGGGEG